MDQKGTKKIGVLSFFILVFGVTVGLCIGKGVYENRLMEKQKQEIAAVFPEEEPGILENVTYYEKKRSCVDISFTLLLVVFWSASTVACFGLFRRRERQLEKKRLKLSRRIYEYLLDLQKGKRKDRLMAGEEDLLFSDIIDKINDLSFYMDNLEERLFSEENSTKELITNISHQLKTPLASIRLNYELARESTLTKEEQNQILQTEEAQIRKMELLLEEMMKLSRLENHMIRIRKEEVSMVQTIREAVSRIYLKVLEKKITIEADLGKDLLVNHDARWTEEALLNLLDNAVKYSESGTTIRIRMERLTTYVLIEIADEGMGIPTEERHKIFERFYRGNQAKQKEKNGTGVGLYLSKMIIEQQGGSIVVKSSKPHGTTMKITLPI